MTTKTTRKLADSVAVFILWKLNFWHPQHVMYLHTGKTLTKYNVYNSPLYLMFFFFVHNRREDLTGSRDVNPRAYTRRVGLVIIRQSFKNFICSKQKIITLFFDLKTSFFFLWTLKDIIFFSSPARRLRVFIW